MAHNLTIRRSGQVEFAYTGEKAWHGLGTAVPVGSSVETWRAAAGMEWSVDSAPVEFSIGGERFGVGDRRVLHRSDTKMPLGIVSAGSYNIVQPAEILEFFRDLADAVGLPLTAAGTIFGGKRFWATAEIGRDAMFGGADELQGYLLLTTSCDGSTGTIAKMTTIRTVCHNTLSYALSEEGRPEVKIYHSSVFNADRVKEALGVAPRSFETFMRDMRRLSGVAVSVERAAELSAELLGTEEDTPTRRAISEKFAGAATGYDLPGFAGTAWGWLNSVTEHVDHGRKAASDSHRMNTALFGSGDRLKTRALELASALL